MPKAEIRMDPVQMTMVPYQSLARRFPGIGAKEFLLSVIFGKTSSSSYPLALDLARGAPSYDEGMIEGKLFHVAHFAKDREGAQRAYLLLNHAAKWSSFEVYARGRPIHSTFDIFGVLQCYLEALACSDFRAHCLCVIEDNLEEKSRPLLSIEFFPKKITPPDPIIRLVNRFSFPCSRLLRNFSFRFQPGHPASKPDQIQAEAVKKNIDICPIFDPASFKDLGLQIVKIGQK